MAKQTKRSTALAKRPDGKTQTDPNPASKLVHVERLTASPQEIIAHAVDVSTRRVEDSARNLLAYTLGRTFQACLTVAALHEQAAREIDEMASPAAQPKP